jgi:hypothetical protein
MLTISRLLGLMTLACLMLAVVVTNPGSPFQM